MNSQKLQIKLFSQKKESFEIFNKQTLNNTNVPDNLHIDETFHRKFQI